MKQSPPGSKTDGGEHLYNHAANNQPASNKPLTTCPWNPNFSFSA